MRMQAKIRSLALLLGRHIPNNILLTALKKIHTEMTTANMAVNHETLIDTLAQYLKGGFHDKMSYFTPGWWEDASYIEGHSPFELSDEDYDGIPRFFEMTIGTNPAKEDTDKDGWTDLSETFALSDPISSGSRPDGIMPDGSFRDWQELLPNLVNVDAGVNSAGCPGAADVTHYAALFDGKNILIAAAGRDLWTKPPYVRWEVQLEVNTALKREVYTLKTVRNRYYYDVLKGNERRAILRYPSAKPLGIDSMEWFLSFEHIGIEPESLTEEGASISYRVSTIFEGEERILCDDTAWTAPIYSMIEKPQDN